MVLETATRILGPLTDDDTIQFGFERERHGTRKFWAQLLYSNWRDDSAKEQMDFPIDVLTRIIRPSGAG